MKIRDAVGEDKMINQEVATLLSQLEICQDNVDEISEEECSKQEIKIYRKLIRLETDNIDFKYCLAKLLLGKGQDEKLRYKNNVDAYDLFEEVLELKPDYAQAHYHMGWLDQYKEHWIESIEHFTVALASPVLGHIEQITALCSRAYCLARISNKDDAMLNLAEAKELAQDRMERNFVEGAEQTVSLVCSGHSPNFGQSRQFVLIDEKGVNSITSEEADSITNEEGFLVLDLRARKPTFSRHKGQVKVQVKLEDGQAQLLEYLLVHSGYQDPGKIREEIWPESTAKDVVKQYIKKLRLSLIECFQTDIDDLIGNMPRVGYRWQSDIPFRIIKPVTFTWIKFY